MYRLLASARWETKASGLIALSHDWVQQDLPKLELNPPAKISKLERAEAQTWATRSGYWIENGRIHFFLWKLLCPDARENSLFVCGPFNRWGTVKEMSAWSLHAVCLLGVEGYELSVPIKEVMGNEMIMPFKFYRDDGHWLEPPHDADNIERDQFGNRNLQLSLDRTNLHVFRFRAVDADPTTRPVRIIYEQDDLVEFCEILASDPLDVLEPPGPFGATVAGEKTIFRVFAPRAQSVSVGYTISSPELKSSQSARCELKPEGQGAWMGVVDANLSNCAYLLNIDGRTMADPWARKMAHVHPSPPVSLVTPRSELLDLNDGFKAPAVEDCVILEVHLKDLFGLIGLSKKPNFKNAAEWIRQNGDYFKSLGVNAVELLPCTDYERGEASEYHWGYMPITAFAPATAYATDDSGITAITEFQDLVRAFHEAGIAVIMDMVLNHFGSPNSLLQIDQSYYFRTDVHGQLSNWSGCGNDVRAEAPMFRRLVLNSLQHWTGVLGVDGFRLDLAELLGTPLLHEIEEEFRITRPNKILIAEPWSFRGHIARDLDHTTWTCWDDAFREFLPAYVRGHARSADLLHQIAACDFRPSARLRYAQSHDDMAWIDRITECINSDALDPTPTDILRTRMMHLILLTSAGVPMLSAGQEFLLSKRGVSNTWRRGDLNSLDAQRLKRFHSEHEWVAQLIKFRLSTAGAVMRPRETVSSGWMKVTQTDTKESFVAVLNANGLLGPVKVMIACNPHHSEVQLAVPMELGWRPVVVSPHPDCKHAPGAMPEIAQGLLTLGPLGCGVWVVEA